VSYTCSTDVDCPTGSGRCVSGYCTTSFPCSTPTDCYASYDTCYGGKCVPHTDAVCTTTADCGRNSHCDAETGHCGRGP
jgi:hypothetical protein